MKIKKIKIKNQVSGPSLKYLGWSGRGWIDGGSIAAGPLSCLAPAWDSYSQEVGVNMARMGFSIKQFLTGTDTALQKMLHQVKKGLENTQTSWAKSANTSYSYAIQRCHDLGWKLLICLNPSYASPWDPITITSSADYLQVWKNFCYNLAKIINSYWPEVDFFFEIANEPDIGYFDGESFLPGYHGLSGGLSPLQYSLLLEKAVEGLKEAVPEVKIFGPGLARWNRSWVEKVLQQGSSGLSGFTYHNVAGHLNEDVIINEARQRLSQYDSQVGERIINSEWAWWPNHDISEMETAIRIAQILYHQVKGQAFGSLYLGPAQPKNFHKGLGVIKYNPDNPNQVERTKTFFAFRLMARGILGEKQLAVNNPLTKLKILALLKTNQELIITIINPTKKKYTRLSLCLESSLPSLKIPLLKLYRLDSDHNDHCQQVDYRLLENFQLKPKSILQFVLLFDITQ